MLFAATTTVSHASYFAIWWNEMMDLPTYFKGLTKQINVSSNKLGEYIKSRQEAYVNFQNEQSIGQRTLKAWNEYSPVNKDGSPLGQLSNPCYQTGIITTTDKTIKTTQKSISDNIDLVYASDSSTGEVFEQAYYGLATRKVGVTVPLATDRRLMQQEHRERYCTVDEAKLGYCQLEPNGMQGADSNWARIEELGTSLSAEGRRATSAFIATVAPKKQPERDQTRCDPKNTGCYSITIRDHQNEALMSMARNSMIATMETRSSQNKTDAFERP